MASHDDDDLDWEEWNGQGHFAHHMLAGSFAGLAEHISIFPLDTIKTHMQCDRCGSTKFNKTWTIARDLVRQEGVGRLWRGVTATFSGCLPAHAAYFSVYESSKRLAGITSDGHAPVKAAIVGAGAALSHDLFMTPFDTVKQRMQLGYYNSVWRCTQSILQTEGIRALYVALPATLAMNLPYGMIMVATNESCKTYLNPSGEYSLRTAMVSGSIAGGVAAAFTNPLDIVKTRLQTNNLMPCILKELSSSSSSTPSSSFSTITSASASSQNKSARGVPYQHPESLALLRYYNSTPESYPPGRNTDSVNTATIRAARNIFNEAGLGGYFRGVVPRVLTHAPAVAISWSAYESAKAMLEGRFFDSR